MHIPRPRYSAPKHKSRRGFILVALALAAGCVFFGCRNPFFPPTGTPDAVPPLRLTPAGVIKQLILAYELKSMTLFNDLFPKSGSFQFYVCPSFVALSYKGRPYSNPPEERDPRLFYIGSYPYYYYWTQSIEIKSHKNMFDKAESIKFTKPPSCNPGDFRYLIQDGDTTNVEMLVTDGTVFIKFKTSSFSEEETIEIVKQVLFLERDDSDLWVIRKWYDFGY